MNTISEIELCTQKGPVDRIPVTLLTGFLGAGKTTLLNHWMHQPGMAGVAVLVNEFGEVGIDHHLVDAVSDQMLLLDSGCLCCTVQGDLVAAFRKLSDRMARGEIAPISACGLCVDNASSSWVRWVVEAWSHLVISNRSAATTWR